MATGSAYYAERADLRREFAERFRRLRKDRFRSQEAFAEHAHLHRVTIGDLEQGRTDPPLSTLLIVADALDVSLDDLVEGMPIPKQRKPPPPRPGSGGRTAPRKS